MFRVWRRGLVHTFCVGENGSNAAESHAREIAETGFSWIIMMPARVQISVSWHPCTDLIVFQKLAAGASPEEHFSDGPDLF
jgi:hypothetical protein